MAKSATKPMTIEKVFAVTAPAVVAKLATEEGYFLIIHHP